MTKNGIGEFDSFKGIRSGLALLQLAKKFPNSEIRLFRSTSEVQAIPDEKEIIHVFFDPKTRLVEDVRKYG